MPNLVQQNLWAKCENYLSVGNTHYSITKVGRNRITLYQTAEKKSFVSKILKIASFALILPPLFALGYSLICRKIVPFDSFRSENPAPDALESNCDVLAMKDSRETHEWRKKLISVAQHNIVISGNYCGGHAFDEILTAIDERMKEVPLLQVVIIAHPKFIENNRSRNIRNRDLLQRLTEQYHGRFQLVRSPDSFLGSKRITNHTKCTVIDYGKYFIQGGSGIKDNFVRKGKLHKHGQQESTPLRAKDDIGTDAKPPLKTGRKFIADDIGLMPQHREEETVAANGSFLERALPSAFRDQDFVFLGREVNKVGEKVFQEALYLAYKWDQYGIRKHLSPDTWDLDKLSDRDSLFERYPALSRSLPIKDEEPLKESDEQPQDGHIDEPALYRLLKTPIPQESTEPPHISPLLDIDARRRAQNVPVRTFFTGPEDRESDWQKTLLNRIEGATHRVVIDQMYFQPPTKLLKAIADAANRGVQVTIVTSTGGKLAPRSDRFFGPRNRYNLYSLYSAVKKQNRKNLEMHAFFQAKNGLHKKVVIVDDYVLAGSSNMGTKSLELTGDHEMNFEAHSHKLAEKTLEIVNKDIRCSRPMKKVKINVQQRMQAAFHRAGAFFWG
jgi:hypothetical protein